MNYPAQLLGVEAIRDDAYFKLFAINLFKNAIKQSICSSVPMVIRKKLDILGLFQYRT